ncbi:hypothetical protein N658DRAFT_431536 [Parathielavia hyrcaniae]|uniref:Uncharacterized protein n=1 Tax=Parathielavia hyrcaniae TaxID=113614 RepID=A0AAN6PXZ4_9PEZI|nr:hypothetical protein N658DRAFT_431536 [Parathielavia hyrcaniae]
MASSAVATHVNGDAALSRPDSPASTNSSTKRKRESSDDNQSDLNARNLPKPAANGVHTCLDSKSLIRDLYDVLQSHDPHHPSILKRPLPETLPDGEPSSKRAKSEETSKPLTIADKVTQDAYEALDDLVSDIVQTANAQAKELETAGASGRANALTKTIAFRTKALELYRRELSYPDVPRPASGNFARGLAPDEGGLVLTAIGPAPTAKPVFSSLQRGANAEILARAPLPKGVTVTKIVSDPAALGDKNGRSLTLGDLFPSPRNLPPLQPPKTPKTTTKSNVLTFYHPELAEKSKYRSGSYFSQSISTGNWLDYTNATPTAHAKTKQRERAQSLAGVKPSTIELEIAEMESLFRGAFSAFAPCKDDSGAIVPAGQVGRIWWQRVGRRSYAKMAEAEEPEDDNEGGATADSAVVMEIDENRVKDAIENWDETAIDPGLDHALGKISDQEKEVDDLLEEVSDLIETLASYQRNRNLTLPTSQDRYSADPVNGDMLRNGSLSHQPSEEEMMSYEALKAQLSLIIQTLPPYAVARLNSDKLAELAVSTKIEISSDDYHGVMEEDEPARLQRLAQAVQQTSTQRQAHRTPSVSGQYASHQYQAQFTPSARPVGGVQQHFPQTPVRPQAANMYSRAPSSVPIPQPHQQVQPRPAPGTQFRPTMYAPQLAKAQGPYGHSHMSHQFAANSSQPRMQPHANYNMAQPGTPNPRFPQGYPAGYQQHQQIQPHPQNGQPSPHPQMSPHQPPMAAHGQQQPYIPYANGGQMPRTLSPQVSQAHPYSQSPTPPQQHQQMAGRPPYGSPGPGMPPNVNAVPRQYGAGSPGPGMVQGPPAAAGAAGGASGTGGGAGTGGNSNNNRQQTPSNLTGFATVMPEVQQRQVMEQARARADAEQRASGHMGKVSQTQQAGGGGPPGDVVGLAGIGLAGHMDVHKVAAAKMQQQQQQQQQQQMMMMGGGGGGPPPPPQNQNNGQGHGVKVGLGAVNGGGNGGGGGSGMNSPRPIQAAPVGRGTASPAPQPGKPGA